MKTAIISDIHGNIHALEAVLKDIKEQGADEIVCLGDMVAYGARSNEVIETVRETAKLVLCGNHEMETYLYALNKIGVIDDHVNLSKMREDRKKSLEWTANKLTRENFIYISFLKPKKEIRNTLYVHASPKKGKEVSDYIWPGAPLWDHHHLFRFFKRNCFVGHTHIPFIILKHKKLVTRVFSEGRPIKIKPKSIINPGSVGQPRDNDPRASYAIYNSKNSTIDFKRIEYDVKAAAKDILDNGLPEFHAKRLYEGK